MTGTATLTHDFPDGPEILSPTAGAKVPADQVVVRWAPVTTPAGIDIGGYQVLVVQEEPVLRVYSADLPADATTCRPRRIRAAAHRIQGRGTRDRSRRQPDPHRTHLPQPLARNGPRTLVADRRSGAAPYKRRDGEARLYRA